MYQKPLISLGLPVYNGAKYIAETIESLLTQTCSDFELVISDNGSDDATPEICARFASQDSRIRFHRSEVNRGARWNFPHVFHVARGKYFKWVAHDDLCAPALLEECVNRLESDSHAVLCMCDVAVIDRDGRLVIPDGGATSSGCASADEEIRRLQHLRSPQPSQRFLGVLLLSLRCYEIFGLMRTECMARSGLYRGYNGSEKVFLAEMSLMGRFAHVPQVLFYSRWHDERFSANPSEAGQNALVDPTRRYRLNIPAEVRCGVGYFGLPWFAPLPLSERLRCLAVWCRFVGRADKWRRLAHKMVTGSSNVATISPRAQRGPRVQWTSRRTPPGRHNPNGSVTVAIASPSVLHDGDALDRLPIPTS